MTGTVSFDPAPPTGTINFGIGQPSADLLPVELMRRASERNGEPLRIGDSLEKNR